MNADIQGEHDAVVHYLMHAWTVAQVYGPQIEAIARDEMQHLKWLAHTVVHLRGTPDFSPRMVSPVSDLKSAVTADIAAENAAIAQYEDHIRQISDMTVQNLLRRIVLDERDHRRQFEEMLSKIDETDGELAGPSMVATKEVAQNLQKLLSYEYGQVLEFLFRYFVERHNETIGMGDEDRAIEEMKHLGWIAESMVALGTTPSWLPEDNQTGSIEDGSDEVKAYERLAEWAQNAYPEMIPRLHRIIGHEQYQNLTRHIRLFTVGSLKESVSNPWHKDVSQEKERKN